LFKSLLFLFLGLGFSFAYAQYPDKTIRLIVPFPAGGGADAVARLVAERLSVRLEQTVMVDNRAGAGGSIGALAVANAPSDDTPY
jgi:tripartite-type tricarboxylate transporter receptor subunit TctC